MARFTIKEEEKNIENETPKPNSRYVLQQENPNVPEPSASLSDRLKQGLAKFGQRFTPSGAREEAKESRANLAENLKQGLKGTIEGTIALGQAMGPLQGYNQEEEAQKTTQLLNKALPTKDEYEGRSLRRGLKEAPLMLASPGGVATSILPRSIVAGFLGEGAKDFGAPEWAQSALELTSFIGPDITKKLLASGNNKKIIEEARKFGLTDEQITPLLQSEFKQKWLAKLAPRRGAIQESLKETKSGLSNAYSSLSHSPAAKTNLDVDNVKTLMGKMSDIVEKMPDTVRQKVRGDAKDLISKPITPESLMNFYADINANLSGNTQQLSRLKGPIKEAISKVDPALGKDFNMVNELFEKYYTIANRLEPNLVHDIVSSAEAIGALGGLMFGNYTPLLSVAGHQGAKQIARHMLTNPRFQQLGEKMVAAIKANKFGTVKKINDLYADLVKEDSPELAKKLRGQSREYLENYIKNHEKSSVDQKKMNENQS